MCGLAFEARQPKEVDQQCSHRGVIVHYQDPPPSGLRVLTAAYHPSSPRMPQRTSCLSTGYQPRNGRLCADPTFSLPIELQDNLQALAPP